MMRAALCLKGRTGRNLFHHFTFYDGNYWAAFMSTDFETILNHFLNFDQSSGIFAFSVSGKLDRPRPVPVYPSASSGVI
jgi:hypothetical protein